MRPLDLFFPTRKESERLTASMMEVCAFTGAKLIAVVDVAVAPGACVPATSDAPSDAPPDEANATTESTSAEPAIRTLLFRLAEGGWLLFRESDRTRLDHGETMEVEIEALLKQRRRGQGGLGRGQGRKSSDGASYPKQHCVSINEAALDALIVLGRGSASAGARALAARKCGQDLCASAARALATGVTERVTTKLFLDPASSLVFRSAGEGSLSAGVMAELQGLARP